MRYWQSRQFFWFSFLLSSSWRQLSTWPCHTHGPLCCSDVLLHHLFMCFAAQIIRPPDRKSPSGHTTALLPKPYVTHSYKLRQLPYLPCVVFFGAFPLFDLSSSSDFGCRFLLWFQLVCGVFPVEAVWICFKACEFGSVLHFATEFLWFEQFIHHQRQWLYFHPAGMSQTVRDASVSERLRSGLWLVIDGASATHTLSAQLLSMHGQTWWLTSPWLFP